MGELGNIRTPVPVYLKRISLLLIVVLIVDLLGTVVLGLQGEGNIFALLMKTILVSIFVIAVSAVYFLISKAR